MMNVKPCPFCGRTPIIENCGEHRYFVKCKCGIEQSMLYAQRCDAVRRWNRRKTEPQTDLAQALAEGKESILSLATKGKMAKQTERSR